MSKKHVSKRTGGQQQCPEPKGILIAIGGKEDKGNGELNEVQQMNKDFISAEILKRFVVELRGDNRRAGNRGAGV